MTNTEQALAEKFSRPMRRTESGEVIGDQDLARNACTRLLQAGFYSQREFSPQDLYSVATKGLLDTIKKVDPRRSDGEIVTFLNQGIEWAIKDFIDAERRCRALVIYLEELPKPNSDDEENLHWEETVQGIDWQSGRKNGDPPFIFQTELRDAIDTLPAHYRPVFDIRLQDPTATANQIANTLNLDVGTVNQYLTHGRQLLRESANPNRLSGRKLLARELEQNRQTILRMQAAHRYAAPENPAWMRRMRPLQAMAWQLQEELKPRYPDGGEIVEIAFLMDLSYNSVTALLSACRRLRDGLKNKS